MPTLYSPGNATTLLNEYAAKYYKNSNSGITSGDLSSPNYGVQSRGGGFQLQRSPSTNTSNPLPYKESGSLTLRTRNPQQLNIRKPLNLKPPSPAQTQQGGISNALNRSLNFHRQQQASSGNRTSTSGPRGTTQAAKNINNFGSTRGNVASNSGTATVNNAYTPGQRSSAIQRWNAAANKTTSAPRTTTSPGQFAKQQGAQAITQVLRVQLYWQKLKEQGLPVLPCCRCWWWFIRSCCSKSSWCSCCFRYSCIRWWFIFRR